MTHSLYRYQQDALDWLASRPKAFLALDQGLGKTIVAVMDLPEPPYRSLIVCPATMVNVWVREMSKWRPELTADTVSIMSYERFTKREPGDFRPDHLVFDEAHYLKTPGAKRTEAARKIIRSTKRVRLLSGTPIVNRPMEIYAMLKAIGGTSMDWRSFAYKYCAAWQTPWNTFDTTGASNLDELYDRLKDHMYRLTKATALPELPAKSYRVVEFDMKLSSRELQLKKEMISTGALSIPFEAISDILRMNGEMKVPMAARYITDVLKGSGDDTSKVVVFCWHKAHVTMIAELLKEFGVVTLTGETPVKRRLDVIDKFQTDPDVRVFIGNIKAAGVGITLTAASHVIFVETTWVPGELHQAADRCHRIGQANHVQVDILTIRESIDALMLHAMLDKTEIIDQLIKETVMSHDTIAKIRALLDQLETDMAPPVAPTAMTIDNLRESAASLMRQAGNEPFLSVLKKFKATKLSDLKPSQYGTFYDAMCVAYGVDDIPF